MRLVFKKKQPIFRLSVNVDIYFHGACVYFFRLVEFVEFSLFFQIFNRNGGNIHQTYGLGSSDTFADGNILIVGILQNFIFKLNAVNYRLKGGMTAMIRPVRINHTNFGNRRVSFFRNEIIAAERNIVGIHCKAVLRNKFFKSVFIKISETVERFTSVGIS